MENSAISLFGQNLTGSGIDFPEPENERNPLLNKVESFYSRQVQLKKDGQIQQVLNTIRLLGVTCDRDIAIHTGIAPNLIPHRRGVLEKKGLIVFVERKVHPVTLRNADYYRVSENV